MKKILVLGEAKTGKTRYILNLLKDLEGKTLFLTDESRDLFISYFDNIEIEEKKSKDILICMVKEYYIYIKNNSIYFEDKILNINLFKNIIIDLNSCLFNWINYFNNDLVLISHCKGKSSDSLNELKYVFDNFDEIKIIKKYIDF